MNIAGDNHICFTARVLYSLDDAEPGSEVAVDRPECQAECTSMTVGNLPEFEQTPAFDFSNELLFGSISVKQAV